MSSPEFCPFCRNRTAISGHYFAHETGGWGGPSHALFQPDDIEVPALTKALTTPCAVVEQNAKACVHCGKVWGDLDTDKLQTLLRKYGTERCQARLSSDLKRAADS